MVIIINNLCGNVYFRGAAGGGEKGRGRGGSGSIQLSWWCM